MQATAMATWEVTPPKPLQLGNPALAGLPQKPRCEQCNNLLVDGRCLFCAASHKRQAATDADQLRVEVELADNVPALPSDKVQAGPSVIEPETLTEEASWGCPPEDTLMESVADDPPDLGKCSLRWEPVNVALVSEALNLDVVRRVQLDHYSAFDVLLSIQRRATRVTGQVGWIAVAECESQPVDGKPQRLYSGIGGLSDNEIPAPVRRELERGVPAELAGVSAFHFSRSLKYLIRGGLGLVEYDGVNAFFEVLKLLVPQLPEHVQYYCDNREHCLQEIAQFLSRQQANWKARHAGRRQEAHAVCGIWRQHVQLDLRTVRAIL